MADSKHTGYKLPINPSRQQGTIAQGFVTPKQDRTPQIQNIPPNRVLPVIFIPGIMGSNLRMSAERQRQLGLKSNIAWRPDHTKATIAQSNDSEAERQLRLDAEATELDIYDPETNPTGDFRETADDRNSEVRVSFMYSGVSQLGGPMLESDLPGTPNPKTKDKKARERGWGEIYFSSYQEILFLCEEKLNSAFINKNMDVFLKKYVAGVNPKKWQASNRPLLNEVTEDTIRNIVKGCWFPVHAMGYNWLKANSFSGTIIAARINNLIKKYQTQGFECEKVILVTHSMGGLVARAVIHPEMGNLKDKILGIVHGVMPAIGAGTAYKRVRCGFEGSGIPVRVLGNTGTKVTAVLANAQGGLELLPSQAYGNHWLQVMQNGKEIKNLPEKGDPYEEIYKVRNKWYGLLREDWINPAQVLGAGFNRTCALLDRAKDFHNSIESTYHDQSYAHYGADSNRMAWHRVVWDIEKDANVNNINMLAIVEDDNQGKLKMRDPTLPTTKNKSTPDFSIILRDAADPGDQTVPLHSADAQLRSGKFKGIFRQNGYEHQSSYNNPAVLAATLYSLLQIAGSMQWQKK